MILDRETHFPPLRADDFLSFGVPLLKPSRTCKLTRRKLARQRLLRRPFQDWLLRLSCMCFCSRQTEGPWPCLRALRRLKVLVSDEYVFYTLSGLSVPARPEGSAGNSFARTPSDKGGSSFCGQVRVPADPQLSFLGFAMFRTQRSTKLPTTSSRRRNALLLIVLMFYRDPFS